MKQQNIPVASLVDMIERGELQLPEMQRRYVTGQTNRRLAARRPSESRRSSGSRARWRSGARPSR